MKHIVIDGRMMGWPGIGRYSINLIQNLEKLDNKNQYTVLVRPVDNDLWNPRSPNFVKAIADIEPYSFKEQAVLPFLIYGQRPDLVHFTSQNSPIVYLGKHITTIHDLILFEHDTNKGSNFVYQIKKLLFKSVVLTAIRKSMFILTDTKHVRDGIIRRYGGATSSVITTYLGIPDVIDSASKPIIEGDYILCVGSFYPHKNLKRLIRAYKEIHAELPNLKLVFVGKEDHFSRQLNIKVEKLGLSKSVKFLGYVSDEDLAWLYQNASLYIFPSLSEGFGLPGLEAMSYGAPVVSSNATCLPEVYGDAAVYFDPTSSDDMAQVILETLNNKELLQKLREAGPKHAKKFSWRKMAEQTLEVYEKALRR